MWDSLLINHHEEYNFSHRHFWSLYTAAGMGYVEETEALTRLYKKIFNEFALDQLKEMGNQYLLSNPSNEAVMVMMDIIEEK